MTRSVLPLFVAALAAGPLAAQPAKPDAARDAERAEDIEVLRRILNRGLGLPDKVTAYPLSLVPHVTASGTTGLASGGAISGLLSPTLNLPPAEPGQSERVVVISGLFDAGQLPAPRASGAGPFDGVYLPGHGVVFTLRVPELLSVILDPPTKASYLAETCRKCHTTEPVSHTVLEPEGKAAAPESEWDRTRRELHGQSIAEQPKVVARLTRDQVCDPGTLANQIIAKLQANAGRVRHLAAGEFVTVVVTFDGHAGSPRVRQNFHLTPRGLALDYGVPAPSGPPSKWGFTPDESRQLTLGDLHLKQGKAKEAAVAYEQGLARYKEPVYRVAPPQNTTAAQRADLVRELQKGVRDAFAKLAQAYLAAGEVEKAQTALDQARSFKAELTASDGSPAGVPVPAKLIISVPVAELTKADGDPATFRRAVKVETVGFPPADKQPKK